MVAKKKETAIAIDSMGGDFAPAEIVKGAVFAARDDPDTRIILVGKPDVVETELSKYHSQTNMALEPASKVIKAGEHSALKLRSQADTSIAVGLRLVKQRRAAAFISAGDTGAVMSNALFTLGRIRGILRPAIAIVIPTPNRPLILLDAGANADCKPENMVQFAKIGAIYAEKALGIANPSVGLLNIGEEQTKGNILTQRAYELLEKTAINFIGSIEGMDISLGKVDVAVCDGFTGNVILKLLEGAAQMLFSELKDVIGGSVRGRLAGVLISSGLKNLREKFDYQEYGGAYLLGVDGICVISHGGSKAKAIKNAIGVAAHAAQKNMIEEMKLRLED